jgi:hypothetical protein
MAWNHSSAAFPSYWNQTLLQYPQRPRYGTTRMTAPFPHDVQQMQHVSSRTVTGPVIPAMQDPSYGRLEGMTQLSIAQRETVPWEYSQRPEGNLDGTSRKLQERLHTQLHLSWWWDDGMITPNDDLLHRATKIGRCGNIGPFGVENMRKLASGSRHYPVIVLLNPSLDADSLEYDAMIERCPTLMWVRDTLKEIGLSLDDVIILDAIPLFSDRCLNRLGSDGRAYAIGRALDLTREILQRIKPHAIISCQCKTNSKYKPHQDSSATARQLGEMLHSSTTYAFQNRMTTLQLSWDTQIEMVYGFHPMYFLYRVAEQQRALNCLSSHFQRLFSPCAWHKDSRSYRLRNWQRYISMPIVPVGIENSNRRMDDWGIVTTRRRGR